MPKDLSPAACSVEVRAIQFSSKYPTDCNTHRKSPATVLAMLEVERRTGLLEICSEDGSVITATLRNGTNVGSRSQEMGVDPVEGMREALRFAAGHFSFRQSGVEVASGPPRSVGSVLLEATSRNDAAAKAT